MTSRYFNISKCLHVIISIGISNKWSRDDAKFVMETFRGNPVTIEMFANFINRSCLITNSGYLALSFHKWLDDAIVARDIDSILMLAKLNEKEAYPEFKDLTRKEIEYITSIFLAEFRSAINALVILSTREFKGYFFQGRTVFESRVLSSIYDGSILVKKCALDMAEELKKSNPTAKIEIPRVPRRRIVVDTIDGEQFVRSFEIFELAKAIIASDNPINPKTGKPFTKENVDKIRADLLIYIKIYQTFEFLKSNS